jgi:pilus assembly protein CpaE
LRVLIVDDIADTRDHIKKLLSLESDIEVVGTARDGAEALEVATSTKPDIVLMDINLPGMDGIEATDQLARRLPQAAVIMISIQADPDYLRRSMLAGAREFLVKPFGGDELVAAMRTVHERNQSRKVEPVAVGPGRSAAAQAPQGPEHQGKVVALFSPKGGAGRSTLAVNLAVAAATELKHTVSLFDASLQFGDVALLLNLDPKAVSVADILGDINEGRPDAVEGGLVNHASGVKVLLPPPSPEVAELVTPRDARTIVDYLRENSDLVVIDCWPLLQEPVLAILDAADVVLCVVTLDLTSIKNARMFLGVADKLGYLDGKLKVVLNRADSAYGISVADVERSIGHKVDFTVVSDARMVVQALNRGVPFFSLDGKAQISRDVVAMARALAGGPVETEEPVRPATPLRRLALARR